MKTRDVTENLYPLLAGAAAILLAAIAAPAVAADRADAVVQAIAVRHVDRHPASDAAARTLLARLDRAAIEACGGSPFSLRETKEALRAAPCWNQAVTKAVAEIDDPRLNQAFRRDRGKERGHAG